MSEQALIDGLTLAREGKRIAGEFAVAALPRLEDLLFERSGVVAYSIAGFTDGYGKPRLDLAIEASLALVCQRCLGRLDYDLRRNSRLILLTEGQSLPDVGAEDPAVETVPAAAAADVADLVEQEVLLGLPIAPAHAVGLCVASLDATGEKASSPFAVLGKLKEP